MIEKSESLDNKCRTSPDFLELSVAHSGRVPSVRHELTGVLNSGNLGKMNGGTITKWTQASAASSWWDDAKLWDSWQDLYRWAAPSGYSSRKCDISEPPAFPGFTANYLMWRKAVLRRKMTMDHAVEKLGTKVMNSLDWTVQAFVDARISAEALLQPDAVAGWIQEDESKLLLRKALFSVERGKDESLRQYTTRRLAQIEAASTAALVTMPPTTWGTVLKEGARLTKQSEQNLNTLLNGSTELDDVARALNMLDVESQEGIIKTPVKPVVHSMETGASTESQLCEEETDETNDQSDEEEEELCPPLEETMAASWIAQIGEEDLSETEAVDSFIAMKEQRKRTWAQAQVLKKEARKDRGFFSSRAGVRNRGNASRQMRQSLRRSPNPMDGDGTPKDLRARLRKENKCFRCKKKGHWKNECPEKQHNRDGTAPAVFSGLTFLHTVNEESVWSAATWSRQYDEDAAWATGSPGIPPGHLIVDSAAGQALIGEAACVEWEQKLSAVGLRGVRVNSKVTTPKGAGGTAHPTRSMMMLTTIDGLSGVLHYTVAEEDIPGLLPLSFQEKQGAMINLRTNKLLHPHLRAVVPMHRTQGGHRTIDVTLGLTPVTFRVPEEVSQRFGLSWHQFVMGDTVERSIRSGNDQIVTKDETREMCRGKISKSISHFTPSHNMVTIHHQDTVNRRHVFVRTLCLHAC